MLNILPSPLFVVPYHNKIHTNRLHISLAYIITTIALIPEVDAMINATV